MKKAILLFAFLAVMASALSAQTRPIRKFIHKHNNGPENVSFTVPGWLIGLASDIGMSVAEEEEERAAFQLAQSLGTTRFLTFQSSDFNTNADIKRLLKELEHEHGFERWATVRAASGERIDLTVGMKGDHVRHIVAIINASDDGQTVFLHARTDFTAEEVGEILNELME